MKKLPKNEAHKPISRLKNLGLVHRESTGKYFHSFEGQNVKGEPIKLLVPREDPASKVMNQLVAHGFNVHGANIDALAKGLNDDPGIVVTEAARLGLRADGRTFVTFDTVLGEGAENLVPPGFLIDSAVGCLRRAGSLDDFQNKVVPLAKRSSIAMMAMSAAFATYLLTPLRRPPFGFVIYGKSRLGKSLAQLLAGSTIGYRQEIDLLSFASSANGLLEVVSWLNGHIVLINEVASAEQGKAGAAQALFETAYRLVGGRDKVRHSTFTSEHAGKSGQTSSSIFVLSSERHPDSWAAIAGELRDDGEKARMIGVPAASAGANSIFDLPPEGKSGDELRVWERRQFARICTRIEHTHGVAYPGFVTYMLAEGDRGLKRAATYIAEFESAAKVLKRSPVERQIISNFAIVYAGGAMASDADVFPIKKGVLKKAILGLCQSSLDEMPDPKRVLKANLRILKDRLKAEVPLVAANNEASLLGSAGFRRNDRQGEHFVVRQQSFFHWFSVEADRREVLRWLDEKGFLKGTKSNHRAHGGVAWAESQVNWPDKTRPRSIQIFLPGGLKKFLPAGRQRRK